MVNNTTQIATFANNANAEWQKEQAAQERAAKKAQEREIYIKDTISHAKEVAYIIAMLLSMYVTTGYMIEWLFDGGKITPLIMWSLITALFVAAAAKFVRKENENESFE